MKVLVIEGPNINMLGKREPETYGVVTMEQIHENMKMVAKQANVEIDFVQSNYEGEIVDKIQECLGEIDGIIINPAAYTHTSIAIRDALSAVQLPCIEVHLTNIHRREEFRRVSMTAGACYGQISGFGPLSYHLALIAMIEIFTQIKRSKSQND